MSDVGTAPVGVDDILAALAEPTRLRIVEMLAHEELCVCHLTSELYLSQPLVSHHLRVLRQVGLVEGERHRYWTYYRLRTDALRRAGAQLCRLAESAPPAAGRRRPCP